MLFRYSLLVFLIAGITLLLTFGCRTSPSNTKITTAPEFPFQLDSLDYYGEVNFKKWESKLDSSQSIKYYQGGVLIQAKEKLKSSDTLYYPDVTGIPKEKLSTLTRRAPSRESRRLIPSPTQYYTCELDSNTTKRIPNCNSINYMEVPSTRETFTHYVISPKYEKDYPDGLVQKKQIYNLSYYGEILAVSWDKWKEMGKDTSLYFKIAVPPGYYSIECNKNFNPECSIMQIQQALINRGYHIPLSGIFDQKTKDTLTRYSKDNGLPIPQNGNILIWFPELYEKMNKN